MIGNKGVMASINAMLATDRLSHAFIIEGEDGLGKRTLASYIAAGAVCTGDVRPCGKCKNCHLISVGSHPDISFYPGDNKYSVEWIRAIRQEMYLVPHMAKRRVFIFLSADQINPAGQNALLKVIEEPPAFAVIIFVLPSKETLLETVRSRCVTFSLAPPEREEAAQYIMNVAKRPAGEVYAALDAAGGNIGRALDSLEDGGTQADRKAAHRLLELTATGNVYGMLELLYGYDRDRKGIIRLFEALKSVLAGYARNPSSASSGFETAALIKLYAVVNELSEDLDRNCNIRLLFSNICVKFRSCLL